MRSCSSDAAHRGVVRARPGLALAHRRAAVQRAREPLARPRDRGGRRPGDPRPAGAPDGQPPPEAGRGPLSRPPGARRRLRRRDRPVPQPARRRRARRRPAAAADGEGVRADARRGTTSQLEIRGPAVADVETVFRERWDNPTNADDDNPIARVLDRIAARAADAEHAAAAGAATAAGAAGRGCRCCARTRSCGRAYPFAPDGERSIARGYSKAVGEPRGWSTSRTSTCGRPTSASCSPTRWSSSPSLHVVAVVPRHPDQDGALADRPNRLGRYDALRRCPRGRR